MKLFLRFEIYLWGLFGLLLVVFVFVLFNEPFENWICGLLDLPRKNEVLKFLGFGMGGTLFVLQVLASNKRAKAMEDTATAQAQANLYTEEGQQQDRLKNAIEHLGHESDSVRLSGAYELFNLARGTEDLRKIVFDILCSHIRSTTGEKNYQEKYGSRPSPQIQNLLTLLFVEKHEIFKDLRPNLQGSYLSGVYLNKARLGNAALFEANLNGAHLEEANLLGANLISSKLRDAFLYLGRMQGAVLFETSLQEANLMQAHLQGSILHKTQLRGANLGGTQLQGVTTAKFGMSREFSNRIRSLIDQDSDLSGVDLGEELHPKEVESIVKDGGAITGSFTKEEAERWIAEYESTTS